jgi:hypothetical protein
MSWISATGHYLPPDRLNVLVAWENEYGSLWRIEAWRDTGVWYYRLPNGTLNDVLVLHNVQWWTLLPELP